MIETREIEREITILLRLFFVVVFIIDEEVDNVVLVK